jgi:DDE family transposase
VIGRAYHERVDADTGLAEKVTALLPYLNERQRRLFLAVEARSLGHGGVARVARAAGVSRPTIQQGLRDLAAPMTGLERVRQPGGGRKKLGAWDPALLTDLEALVDPDSRGDPMSPLRWTCKSTRQLATALTQAGHRVSHTVVAELLDQAGYSLQAPAKTVEGRQHPDRDAQFQYLNERVKTFLAAGQSVISVDAKKKELVGAFQNGGREWQPTGQPEQVNVHDFPDRRLGKAIPYGIYDVGRNAGWVTVGQDHDTASFAVASLRRWWQGVGADAYRGAARLLICADGGGSNGYRVRLWKVELQRFADETGLELTVCHLPPGTSKWNKIEHRLFAHISMNWRGRPLISHEVIVELIGATTTQTGLRVQADRDRGEYPTKVKVTDEELAGIRLTPHAFHGEWNYTLAPAPPTHL